MVICIEKVYEFLNFGDRIRSWLKSIGTGRTACIILNSGTNSENFSLNKGHAQGYSPSPPAVYCIIWQRRYFYLGLSSTIVSDLSGNQKLYLAQLPYPPHHLSTKATAKPITVTVLQMIIYYILLCLISSSSVL